MKPCTKYRERIALMAMGALEIRHVPEMRAHVDACVDCRNYMGEISGVARNLRASGPRSDVQPSVSFHRNVVAAVAMANRRFVVETALAQFQSLWNWRVLIPAAAVVALAISAWFISVPRRVNPRLTDLANRGGTKPQSNRDIAPTFLNYEMAANQSLDKLDELLTKEGNRTQQSSPIYATGALSRFNTTE